MRHANISQHIDKLLETNADQRRSLSGAVFWGMIACFFVLSTLLLFAALLFLYVPQPTARTKAKESKIWEHFVDRDIPAAVREAESIRQKHFQELAFYSIAVRLANSGRIDEAWKMAERLSPEKEHHRSINLRRALIPVILRAQVAVGRVDETLGMLDKLHDKREVDHVIRAVYTRLANERRYEDAARTVHAHHSYGEARSEMLIKAAYRLVEAGEIEKAGQIASQSWVPNWEEVIALEQLRQHLIQGEVQEAETIFNGLNHVSIKAAAAYLFLNKELAEGNIHKAQKIYTKHLGSIVLPDYHGMRRFINQPNATGWCSIVARRYADFGYFDQALEILKEFQGKGGRTQWDREAIVKARRAGTTLPNETIFVPSRLIKARKTLAELGEKSRKTRNFHSDSQRLEICEAALTFFQEGKQEEAVLALEKAREYCRTGRLSSDRSYHRHSLDTFHWTETVRRLLEVEIVAGECDAALQTIELLDITDNEGRNQWNTGSIGFSLRVRLAMALDAAGRMDDVKKQGELILQKGLMSEQVDIEDIEILAKIGLGEVARLLLDQVEKPHYLNERFRTSGVSHTLQHPETVSDVNERLEAMRSMFTH